jgi:hypothetical protein
MWVHGATERRIFARFRSDVTAVAGQEPCVVKVANLSRDGLGFFHDHEIKPESSLTIELFEPAGAFWHLKAARVVHATPQPDGGWLIGISFLRELAEAELQTLLNQQ